MTDERPIEGVEWRGDDDTSLRLEQGSGGINRLMGDYILSGDELRFGGIATTMMAGPPERMETEHRFLAALGSVARWSIVGTSEPDEGYSLALADDDGIQLLALVAHAAT